MTAVTAAPLVLALPKGRILKELRPLLSRAGIEPAADFRDEDSRRLRFETNNPGLDVVRVQLDEFQKAGGSAKCLTLRLDVPARSGRLRNSA